MGNDGGTIPRRDELVRMKKKKEQVSGTHLPLKIKKRKICDHLAPL